MIPVPNDRKVVEEIGLKVIEAVRLQELASDLDNESRDTLWDVLGQ